MSNKKTNSIEVDHLSVLYDGAAVLKDVSVSVEGGGAVLITGESGCGKSTLAYALSGILKHYSSSAATEGSVLLSGVPVDTMDAKTRVSRVGIVFQNPSNQLFHTKVRHAVGFTLVNQGEDEEKIRQKTEEVAEQLQIEQLLDRSTLSLSAGEKQLVVLASVLVSEPAVLILDEPTANLDWNAMDRFSLLLSKLVREKGLTAIIFEHRLPVFYRFCSRFIIMHRGSIVFDHFKETIEADRALLRQYGIRYPWNYLSGPPESCMPDGISTLPKREETGFLLSIQNISAAYNKRPVFENISFDVFNGDFLAITGKNGAGKTTLARIITGGKKPSRGKLLWSRKLRKSPLGKRVGYLTQNATDQLLFPTVQEEIDYGFENFKTGDAEIRRELLISSDVEHLLHRQTSRLSVGQMQRVVIASSLSPLPALLILDEPSIGQDWRHIETVMGFLTRFAAEGNAVIIITHDDKIVCRFAKRIIHLENGRITADGEPVTGVIPNVNGTG